MIFQSAKYKLFYNFWLVCLLMRIPIVITSVSQQ